MNVREGWQGRFSSVVMDERYLLAAARYVELNPVKAKLVRNPFRYAWSSARAHKTGEDDVLVTAKPLLNRVDDWPGFLAGGWPAEVEELRQHERTGRPAGLGTLREAAGTEAGACAAPAEGRPPTQEEGKAINPYRVPGCQGMKAFSCTRRKGLADTCGAANQDGQRISYD